MNYHNERKLQWNEIEINISNTGTGTARNTTISFDRLQTRVVIDNEGMALEDQGCTVIADYGTSIRIGRSGQGRVEIFDTGIDIYDGQATPRKRVAIDEDGKAAFGGAAGADVATNSTDDVVRIEPGSGVKIYDNADDYVHLSDAGMTVYEGGNDIAVFAATTRLGDIANDTTRLELSSGDVKFIHRANNNDTGSLTMKADGTIEGWEDLRAYMRCVGILLSIGAQLVAKGRAKTSRCSVSRVRFRSTGNL